MYYLQSRYYVAIAALFGSASGAAGVALKTIKIVAKNVSKAASVVASFTAAVKRAKKYI